MVFVFVIVFAIMVGIGCTEEIDEQNQLIDEQNQLIDDYNKRIDTNNQDVESMNNKLDKYDSALSMALADDDITYEESLKLSELVQDYADEYDYVVPRMEEFKNFITTNEKELKNAEIDTYDLKNKISSDITTFDKNIEKIEEGEVDLSFFISDFDDSSTTDITSYYVIEDGYIQSIPLTDGVSNIMIDSDELVDIYIIDDVYEYERYVDGDDFVHYPNYQAADTYYYDREITIYTDGKVLAIENSYDFGYSANVEVVLMYGN